MRELLYEHNTLNGFWFVLIEFLLVAAVCLLIGVLELAHKHLFWSVAYFGIGVNAVALCGTVIGQMRRGERSSSLRETYSAQGRERIRREHPHLDRHTLQLVAAILVPFLLAALALRNEKKAHR